MIAEDVVSRAGAFVFLWRSRQACLNGIVVNVLQLRSEHADVSDDFIIEPIHPEFSFLTICHPRLRLKHVSEYATILLIQQIHHLPGH